MSLTATLRSLWPLYRRFLDFAKPDRGRILLCCFFVLGIAITNTAMIWLIATPLNALQQGDFSNIAPDLTLLAMLIVVNQAFHFGSRILAGWLQLRFIGRVRETMLARCMLVSFPVMDLFAKGDLLARLSADLNNTARFTLENLFTFVSHVLIFLLYVGMLFWIDFWLALIACACIPLFLVHHNLFGHRKQQAGTGAANAIGKLLSFETEMLSNLRGISSYGVESTVTARHRGVFDAARGWDMRTKWLDAAFEASLVALIYLGALVIMAAGLWKVTHDSLLIGTLVSFLFYLGYASVPVRGTMGMIMQSHEDRAAAMRVSEILDLTPYVSESPQATRLDTRRGDVLFEDISFQYPNQNVIFRGITVAAKAGETIALVGPSGSGKSTLARLLMRFYDPQQGRILIDDQDIRDVTIASLRQQIAVVWQEPFLVNDSVAANLRLAKQDATDDELIAACKAAHAWEFVETLPQGLESNIGEDGAQLSAGQRQRLNIARAFLRDAPILILDEASSALDSQAEMLIAAALEQLRHGRTTFVIAHRFSALRGAQRVVFFNGDGSITQGTHDQLWETHAAYRTAVEWQMLDERSETTNT